MSLKSSITFKCSCPSYEEQNIPGKTHCYICSQCFRKERCYSQSVAPWNFQNSGSRGNTMFYPLMDHQAKKMSSPDSDDIFYHFWELQRVISCLIHFLIKMRMKNICLNESKWGGSKSIYKWSSEDLYCTFFSRHCKSGHTEAQVSSMRRCKVRTLDHYN